MTIRPHQHTLPIVGRRRQRRMVRRRLRPQIIAASMYPLPTGEAATSTPRPTGSPLRSSNASSFAAPSGSRAVALERCPVLAAHGYKVASTDIADCGFGIPGVDSPGKPERQRPAASLPTRPMAKQPFMRDSRDHIAAAIGSVKRQMRLGRSRRCANWWIIFSDCHIAIALQ